ncbi:MAG: hypothetical protein JWP52_3175 [Rhizobacter sp.]|jgi:DNA-binding CsgD family transcriptional regulator|nr:hypothetical protein [Rhizobacter sp.]
MEMRLLDPLAGIHLSAAESGPALANLIGAVGERAFGRIAIEQINRLVPLRWWTVYRLYDDAPPLLHTAGHLGDLDCVADSFGAYRNGFYRDDRGFHDARGKVRDGTAVMVHVHASEVRRAHRSRIYSRHGLADRLSILCSDQAAGLLAINLYRHVDQAPFGDDERDRLEQLAPLLRACVVRHLGMAQAASADASITAAAPMPSALDALARREREVCERLLRGWTHDGVAADLKLSVTTVKTYRDRAFERLGIHHRNELFALVMKEAGAR